MTKNRRDRRPGAGLPSKYRIPCGGEAATSILALLPALWDDLPALLHDVGRALDGVDHDYAQYLTDQRLMVTAGAQVAVQKLIEAAEERMVAGFAGEWTPPGPGADGEDEAALAILQLFEEAGRDSFRRDRPLRSLLHAYQTGGQVAWQHIAALAVARELPASALAALAEGVFRSVDRISAATTNGYLLEQAESAGMREQLRSALAERLLEGGGDLTALEEAARRLGWRLPDEAAVVFVRPDDQPALACLARLGPGCLPLHSTRLRGVIVPDPGGPGARQRLVASLRGCPALVGPTVALQDLPDSARLALDAAWVLDLPGADGPFFVDDHLDTIIVHRDERLLEALRAQALAPLAGAARGSREAFRQTLRSWLVHMGDRQAVAADLHVHPQTVRYRMGRLQELFGPVLQDPAGRLRLLLALAWDEPAGGSPAAAPAGAADRGRPSRRVHGPHGLRAAVPVRGHR